MSKRLATTLPDDPFARKRFKPSRTVWLGAKCYHVNGTTNKIREKTTSLDLPLELHVVETIKHPCDALPEHSRFESYVTLRLLNRRIGQEVKNIWRKRYEQRLVFCFDNPPQLSELWTQVKRHPRLRNARFSLIAPAVGDKEGDEDWGVELAEDCEMFMEGQPGTAFDTVEMVPRLLEYEPRYSGGQPWNPEDDGFKMQEGGHGSCGPRAKCAKYRELIFPPVVDSLRVWNSSWKEQASRTAPLKKVTSIVEGKRSDIRWDRYNLQCGRGRLWRERVATTHHSREVVNEWYAGLDPEMIMYVGDSLAYAHEFTDGQSSEEESEDSEGEGEDESEEEDLE